MGNDARKNDRVERREGDDNKADKSVNASNEAQDEMRRQSEQKQNGKTDATQPTKDTDGLQPVELYDSSKDDCKVPDNLKYDDQGNLASYRDVRGNEYVRQGDHFVNPKNPVQADGVDIKVDNSTGSVELTDRSTGIKRTTDVNGVETTDYSATGGGKTTSVKRDGCEYITIESTNRPMRSLVIEQTATGGRVKQYTDGQGSTYTCTGEVDDKGKPKYTAVDKDGNAVTGDFRVTADRSGNVVVRNETLEQNDPNYARRELNNGTIVTSSGVKGDGSRKIIDANDREIQDGTPEADIATRSKLIQETPPNVDLAADTKEAQSQGAVEKYEWFQNKVKTGGDWDYKNARTGDNVTNLEYEDYGNWHYGYVGNAAGFSSNFLQQRAGMEQIKQGTSKPRWGEPSYGGANPFGGSGTYGDDPHDNEMIQRGVATRQADYNKEIWANPWQVLVA